MEEKIDYDECSMDNVNWLKCENKSCNRPYRRHVEIRTTRIDPPLSFINSEPGSARAYNG